MSYRSAAFSRVKARNRDTLASLQAAGSVAVMLESQVLAIESGRVHLQAPQAPQGEQALANDSVIVCVGGQLPIALLQKAGVAFDTHYGG